MKEEKRLTLPKNALCHNQASLAAFIHCRRRQISTSSLANRNEDKDLGRSNVLNRVNEGSCMLSLTREIQSYRMARVFRWPIAMKIFQPQLGISGRLTQSIHYF